MTAAAVLHPLIARLLEHPAAEPVDSAGFAAFSARPGDVVLFLWSNPERHPEVLDVAVVLPELWKALSPAGSPGFHIGVVSEASEREFGVRYGETRRPALVFLRDGAYVGVIQGMQDWQVLLDRARALLATPPSRPPSIGIPVVSATAPGCH